MNKNISKFAETARMSVPSGLTPEQWIEHYNQLFAEMIALECAAACGSQADKKNIRKRFGLPVESNVQYEGPDAHGSITSQYTREYNLPK